jgi:hypothetical protein
MLPPLLEIFVVWHPDDRAGAIAADQIGAHFHGTQFTGLIGGAVEVYGRNQPWRRPGDAPRPIPLPNDPPPNDVAQAAFTVIVPVLGFRLARLVQKREGPWWEYLERIKHAQRKFHDQVAVFPLLVSPRADRGPLGELFGRLQYFGSSGIEGEPEGERRCRDLVQAIAQFLTTDPSSSRLSVFVSHTRSASPGGAEATRRLTERVRYVISQTRLSEFFDARDLQPGVDYGRTLTDAAGTSALLAIRSDHYSSREWCQLEMLTAKRAGMPIVIVEALDRGDQRGSFLMDHAPRVATVAGSPARLDEGIRVGLNLLVDQCLKRVLWRRQSTLAEASIAGLGPAVWWAPHAPEPATLAHWITCERAKGRRPKTLRILHPDPPLGRAERQVLEQLATLSGIADLEILTPRQLAARTDDRKAAT